MAPKKVKETGGMAKNACERCGHIMVEDHCRLVCPNCGAIIDCSDV